MHGVIKSGENHHNTTAKKQYLCIKIRRIMANRQEIVCTYIYENYVASGRLRHDVVSNKVQIAVMGDGLQLTGWRDITTADVNDIVCDCSAESGLSIAAKEVLAVLQSHRIPAFAAPRNPPV